MVTETHLEPVLNALKSQDKAHARELLMQLLKAEPKNADLWLLMSTAVETRKEIILCLEKARQADPENQTAISGLVYYGVLKPEEAGKWSGTIPSQDWQSALREKFKNEEKKKTTRPKKKRINLLPRAIAALFLLALVIYGVFFSPLFSRGRKMAVSYAPLGTVKPSATYLPTKTPVGFVPSPTKVGTPALAALLSITYTPTPDYVYTPHSSEAFQLAMRAMQKNDWQNVLTYLKQFTSTEKTAADAYYYMGEAHRAMGDLEAARADYYAAISANANYAPGWLGVARLQVDAKNYRDAVDSLNKALELDPNLGPAYLLLATTAFETNDTVRCQENLEAAMQRMPDNALGYLLEAKLNLQMGNNEQALAAARRCNEIDATLLEDYLILGKAYQSLGNSEKAVEALNTYTKYASDDAEAWMLLGQASQELGRDDQAITAYRRAQEIDPSAFDAFLQPALLYLKSGQTNAALEMLKKAHELNPKDFDTAVNLAELMFAQEDTGNAYMVLIGAEGSVKTDAQKARFLYDRARMLSDLKQVPAAVKDWKSLLALAAGTVPEDQLTEARDFLLTCKVSGCARVTLTMTPGPGTVLPLSGSGTPTQTSTPLPPTSATSPTRLATASATAIRTFFPSATLTPAK